MVTGNRVNRILEKFPNFFPGYLIPGNCWSTIDFEGIRLFQCLATKGLRVTTVLASPLMSNPSKKPRNDKAVKIRRVLANKAKIIAETKGIPIAEYLSDLLEAQIEKDWPKALAVLDKQSNGT